jgi:uncharacterized Zn finger protein
MTDSLTQDYELPPCPLCGPSGEVFEIANPEDGEPPYWCMICGAMFQSH